MIICSQVAVGVLLQATVCIALTFDVATPEALCGVIHTFFLIIFICDGGERGGCFYFYLFLFFWAVTHTAPI